MKRACSRLWCFFQFFVLEKNADVLENEGPDDDPEVITRNHPPSHVFCMCFPLRTWPRWICEDGGPGMMFKGHEIR